MNFINPKISFAFKKIFGDERHKDILISFLNAIFVRWPVCEGLVMKPKSFNAQFRKT